MKLNSLLCAMLFAILCLEACFTLTVIMFGKDCIREARMIAVILCPPMLYFGVRFGDFWRTGARS
eukprot:3563106-Pyramimonas_sp.AAC.1